MGTYKKQFNWREMSFYQIWIRSFADGNGDGIGDLWGVYEKLPYIKSLGVDGIWFSPIYPSPNADFGYDISDYRNIHPDYGTIEQFQKVLSRAHELDLKVLMDLVVNHTSDEHPWFQESRKSRTGPYSDYYIWRDPRFKKVKRLPPNNWYSQFEGLAWEYCPEREQYYLHVFAKKQPDLNMDNPKVREEVKEIMRFWLEMGVDGFREDVITYISKHPQLPDGLPHLPVINGLKYYNEGPNLYSYLREFRRVGREYGALQVGESPFTSVQTALRYVRGKNRVLDMMISFDHMTADCFLTEYVHLPFSLPRLKKAFTRWQTGLYGKGWNALYLENHDHPRIVSRYGSLRNPAEERAFAKGDETAVRNWKQSAKSLAASCIFQRGTPFVYQGQELGMTNIELPSIDDYLDVASKNAYASFHTHASEAKRMHYIHISSRDSARTPVQWTHGKYAGFSDTEPWFALNPNYPLVNAEDEEADPDSILNFYRAALALRKKNAVLRRGSYREYLQKSRRIYCYARQYHGKAVLVVCSFSGKCLRYRLPKGYAAEGLSLLLGNDRTGGVPGRLRPYEAQVWSVECFPAK